MTLSDLFSKIRAGTASALSNAAASAGDAHIEPAFRRRDGELAIEGMWDLPCRADIIPLQGPNAGEPLGVSAETRVGFQGLEVDEGDTKIHVSPFDWDILSLTVCGLDGEVAARVLKEWFWQWFDQDDRNEVNQEGLYGVVHYMSDPAPVAGKVAVQIDLGSAPALALDELLAALSEAGAAELSLG